MLAVLAVAASAQSFGDGTHLVGTEIAAGTYRAPGGDFCRWERLSSLGGEPGSRIGSDLGGTNPAVEIQATDKAFRSEDCGTWTLLSAGPEPTPVPEGDNIAVIIESAKLVLAAIAVSLEEMSYDVNEVAARARKPAQYILSAEALGYTEAHQVTVDHLLDFFEQAAQ